MLQPPNTPPSLPESLRALRRSLSAHWDSFRFATIARARQQRRLEEWDERVRNVLIAPDAHALPRHPDAGKLHRGIQTMHNGLQIVEGSYYGWRGTRMFSATQGLHEPQEERAFAAVLPFMKPNATMIELGAYWAFYSLWFARSIPNASCILLEPKLDNLDLGKANVRLNAPAISSARFAFIRAAISDHQGHDPDLGTLTTVDALINQFNLPSLDILHADVQHAELHMLRGSQQSFDQNKIRFAFVSTHSQELHHACREFLLKNRFSLIADADLDASYSYDGILVAQHHSTQGPGPIPIALRPKA
jgi:FkbM family methyltransferase